MSLSKQNPPIPLEELEHDVDLVVGEDDIGESLRRERRPEGGCREEHVGDGGMREGLEVANDVIDSFLFRSARQSKGKAKGKRSRLARLGFQEDGWRLRRWLLFGQNRLDEGGKGKKTNLKRRFYHVLALSLGPPGSC